MAITGDPFYSAMAIFPPAQQFLYRGLPDHKEFAQDARYPLHKERLYSYPTSAKIQSQKETN